VFVQAGKIGHKIMLPRQRPAFAQLVASLIRDKAALNITSDAPPPENDSADVLEMVVASPWSSFELAKAAAKVRCSFVPFLC
jgi:hypothetical protein